MDTNPYENQTVPTSEGATDRLMQEKALDEADFRDQAFGSRLSTNPDNGDSDKEKRIDPIELLIKMRN
jgi:hypothetical protein